MDNIKDKIKDIKEKAISQIKDKIKSSPSEDITIILAVNTLETLDTQLVYINKRIREWCNHFALEFNLKFKDDEKLIKSLTLEPKELKDKYQLLPEESKQFKIIQQLANHYFELKKLKLLTEEMIKESMLKYKNLNSTAGWYVGSKLLQLSGSLEKLVRMPSSRIQFLGAENKFFRKLGQNQDTIGIIIRHSSLQNSNNKTKDARSLSTKISISARKDFFETNKHEL